MTSKFSGGLKIIDLDDFVAPSQDCIKPVKIEKKEGTKIAEIQVDSGGNYIQINEDGSKTELKKTKIQLADCLACSGCVTSAETVLVNQQSIEEFLKQLVDDTKILIISLSPQSRASIAAHFNMDIIETNERLVGFFKNVLGAKEVFDTTWSNNFSVMEICHEFVDKYKKQEANKNEKILPLFTSNCPGWVCYAEKTCGEIILPHISTTKSPQQVMGTLIKKHYAKQKNIKPETIYHVTIMSCYDKKLEASRDDFLLDDKVTREVDCVLTSGEIIQLLEEKKVDLRQVERVKMSKLFSNVDENGNIGIVGGSSSGGYLESVFKYAAKQLFNVHVDEIKYTQGRNSDFKECSLEVDGKIVLKFALAYGFRNIQNQVRRMKRGKSPYHFIEIQACPSGCINGGGQIRAPDSVKAREYLHVVESKYREAKIIDPFNDEQTNQIYKEWIGDTIYSEKAKKLLHTQYHIREKININPLTIKW